MAESIMKTRRFIKFTDKKHSKQGILSCILGLGSMITFACVVYMAYESKGNAGKVAAATGFLAIIMCVTGMVLGLRSLKEEDSYALFRKLGCFLNGVILLIWMAVVSAGIYM